MERINIGLFEKKWVVPAAIAIILILSALQVFIKFHIAIRIILGAIVLAAFVALAAALLIKDLGANDNTDKVSIYRLKAKRRAAKSTEDIMTISYAAVAVLGTFIGSISVVIIGIVLFVMHTFISLFTYKHFLNKFKDK